MADLVAVTLRFEDGSTQELRDAEAQRWLLWVRTHVDWDQVDTDTGIEPFVWTTGS